MKRRFTLAALPAAVLIASCGGGGGGSEPASAESTASVANPVFTGTAYQKQLITVRLVGKDHGPQREELQKQVDECNRTRDSVYHLPPVQPDETLLAGLDDGTLERYFDTDKAALYITNKSAWLSNGAPDCSTVTVGTGYGSFIWRDGLLYQLLLDGSKKGWVHDDASSQWFFTPRPFATDLDIQALPVKTPVGGESCYVADSLPIVTVSDAFIGQQVCIWDRFPPVFHLSLPWVLSRQDITDGVVTTETSLEAIHGLHIDPSIFEIPTDFELTGP